MLAASVEFCQFALCLFQHGDIGISIFPQCEEIVVGGLRCAHITRYGMGSGELMDRVIPKGKQLPV